MLDARAISAELARRAEALAREILPAGGFVGSRRYWRCGSVHGEPGQSLAYCVHGEKRGQWRDYAAGEGGDSLDLVAAVLFRGDLAAAIRWARDWLGLGRIPTEEVEHLRRRAELGRAVRQRRAERAALIHADDARRVWLAARPLRPGDEAWRYLAGRGIDLALLPRPPAALRCHAGLYNFESRHHWPALVAAINVAGGQHVNTQRTWLLADPASGLVAKAPLQRPKLSMPGGYAGGCVRLWRGASNRPWAQMPGGETVVAGEGLEDVLTIVCARPEWRACAVLSISGLAGLVLPPQVSRLIWIAQNDPPGSPATLALNRALDRHRRAGRRVSLIRPPAGVKDVNDLAREMFAA